MICEVCKTQIITCSRCRKQHCYHHFCPETDGFNHPPIEIWSEEHNQKIIKKLDEVFKR